MRRRLALILVLGAVACGGAPAAPPPSTIPIGAAPTSGPTPPPPSVRWTLPTCPLRYEVLTTERFEGSLPLGASELVTFLSVDATTTASGLELRLSSTAAMKNGKHRPYAVPDTGFPPLTVATDGARWHVVGDSVLFAGFGSQGGLAWLFPDLPDGARQSWDYPVDPSRLNQNGVSVLNSQVFSSPALPVLGKAKPIVWPLREETSTSPDGRLVMRARGPERWSSRSPGGASDFSVLEREGEIRTEHVILPNGRLFRAHLERDVNLTLTVEKSEPIRSRLVQRSDAHLVAACDGPVETSLAPVLTREERAIALVGDLAMALYAEKRPASTIEAFSSGLRAARGDKAILAAIDRYRKGRDENWWPVPALVNDDDVVTKGDRIELNVKASVVNPNQKNTRTPVKFRFDVVETGGRLFIDRVTAAFEIETGQGEVLEIAKNRVFP